jgi:glycerate dehydrogenase
LIGYGKLGQAVAKLGRAFGMEICVHSRSKVEEPGIANLSFEELLATSDVISLHLPLSEKTRHMIDAPQLAQMKPNALLINTARGGLVNEAALAAALSAGSIGGAGFDVLVTEPPAVDNVLLNLRLPNFILTPHVAWASSEAMQALGEQLIDNLDAFAAGEDKNRVA